MTQRHTHRGLALITALLAGWAASASFADEAAEKEAEAPKAPPLNIGGIDREGATVRGMVKYIGKKSASKKGLDMSADPVCHAAHDKPVPRYSDRVYGTNGEHTVLQNVFVWVSKGIDPKDVPAPEGTAVIDQHGCIYVPRVSGMRTGQTLEIRNSDKTNHNVHGYLGRRTLFNDASPPGSTIRKKLDKPQVVTLKCDVHPWMGAHVRVLEHPFFAVTQADGTFVIRGLKPGKYEVSVWHEYTRYVPDNASVTVEVAAGETGEVDFTYDRRTRWRR